RPQAGALTYHLPMTDRRYRAGESIEDICRACKMDRMHTVIVVDADGRPIRVSCGYCDSEHNYRGGPAKVVAQSFSSALSAGPRVQSTKSRDPFPLVSDRE